MSTYKDKLSSKLINFLSKDFFALPPSQRITFLSNRLHKTKLGMFATWVTILLSIFTFLNVGSDMINHQNPSSMISQIVNPDPENVELTPEKLFFAFGLQDLKNYSIHYIDESIYKVEIIKRTKRGSNITLEYLETERCKIENVPDIDDLRDYYKRNNINNLYCIKNINDIMPELKSNWDGNLYKNLLINIKACSNTTSKQICQPEEKIIKYINSANFAIYFTNLAIDSSNYKKPITTFARQLYTPISSNTLTYIEMLFGHINFSTDDGFFFEEIKNFSSINYLSNRQVLSFNTNMFLQIDLKLDKIKLIYKRKYSKIHDALAQVGGVFNILMLVMRFLVTPLINLDFKQKLANSLYNFNQKGIKIKKKNTKYMKKFENKKKKKSACSSKDDSPEYNTYFKQDNSKKLEIGYLEYICSIFNFKKWKIKNNLLKKGLEQVDKFLDINFIMSKLVELEKLKTIILNQEQLNLFEYIPKPNIQLNVNDYKENNLHKKFSSNLYPNVSKKGIKAYKSLQNLMNKEQKSELDKKLIEMIMVRVKGKNEKEKISSKLELMLESQNKKQSVSMTKSKFFDINLKQEPEPDSSPQKNEIILFNSPSLSINDASYEINLKIDNSPEKEN